jgi:hypothetical protein
MKVAQRFVASVMPDNRRGYGCGWADELDARGGQAVVKGVDVADLEGDVSKPRCVGEGGLGHGLSSRLPVVQQLNARPAAWKFEVDDVGADADQANNGVYPAALERCPAGDAEAKKVGVEVGGALEVGDDYVDMVDMHGKGSMPEDGGVPPHVKPVGGISCQSGQIHWRSRKLVILSVRNVDVVLHFHAALCASC